MSMFDTNENIFDTDFDFDAVPDDPFELPPNTYLCEVSSAELTTAKKDETKRQLVLKFQIVEGTYSSFFPFSLYLWVPKKSDTENDDADFAFRAVRAASTLKKYFIAFGFGADEFGSVTPDKLLGRRAYVRTTMQEWSDGSGNKQVKVQDIKSAAAVDAQNDQNGESYDPFK